MADLTALITFTIALLAGAATPGPAITSIIARVLGGDERSAWPYASGIILGDVFWLTAAVVGLSTLTRTNEILLTSLKYVGAGYLAYTAYRVWTANSELLHTEEKENTTLRITPFLAGLALEMGNPKTIAFYLAVLPALLELNYTSTANYLEIVACAICIYATVFAAYISLARRSRKLVHKKSRGKCVQRSSALALAATAVAVVAR